MHLAYLSLGTNILPETNLVQAVRLLQRQGEIGPISSAWESESVGAEGPNYLNACLAFATPLTRADLKKQVLSPIEVHLGRRRSADKFAPRTIDIDIVIFDRESVSDKYWDQAFVVVPLAEILPWFENPVTGESLQETAARLRRKFWMETRPSVLREFNGSARGQV